MQKNTMILSSSQFKDGDILDISFRADQLNHSPDLTWSSAPENTKSFAIAMHDPDAPTGGAGWWHWLAFGIPAHIHSLAQNAGQEGGHNMPEGTIQMKNDLGKRAYMGCYPPPGDPAHRYIFTIYALDTDQLDITPDDTTSKAGFVINQHMIAKASLIGYFAQ